MRERRVGELSLAVSATVLLVLAGCGGQEPRSETAAKPAVVARYAGRWTRVQDGRVFHVEDDGSRIHGELERDPQRAVKAHSFELQRNGEDLVGVAHIDDGSGTVDTKWRLRRSKSDRLEGDNEYVERDPTTGAVTGRGVEHQEFKVEPPASPTAGAADSDLAKLRAAADNDVASSENEEAQRKVLQDAADKETADAEREETERKKLRETADAAGSDAPK